MKKLTLLTTMLVLLSSTAGAVEVGDIMYHDRTFSSVLDTSGARMPIGLVYWVYPSKDHGYVMALNQPLDAKWADAKTYCYNFTTLNTSIGSWRLPDLQELIRMGKEQWNGVNNDKYNILNKKLATITGVGEQLKSGMYHSHTTSSSGIRVDLSAGQITFNNSANTATSHFRCIMQF